MPQEIVRANPAGMNKWLVAFCWIVISVGLYQLWKMFEFGFKNPTSEAFVDSWQGQTIRYSVSVGVNVFGAVIGRWKGFAVSLALVAMAHVALVIVRV